MSRSRDQASVLVFDSGIGGLTVVEELSRIGFQGRIAYAADTGFFPYGDKSDDVLVRRIPSLARRLVDEVQPDLFVIACNTASTLALEVTRAVLDIPVVGTVPAIKPAARLTKTGTIGVLATPGTLKRAYTDALISEFARHCQVLTYGSVQLVALAERFAAGEPVTDDELSDELSKLLEQDGGDQIDQIVLACTHFPLLTERLRALVPPGIEFIDSGNAIARRVMSLLGQNEGLVGDAGQVSRGQVWTTGESPSLERLRLTADRFGFGTVCALEEP